jgi:hypothetical protein
MQRGRTYPGGGLYVQPGAVSSQQLEQHNERQNMTKHTNRFTTHLFDLVCSIDLVDASFNVSYYMSTICCPISVVEVSLDWTIRFKELGNVP